MRWPIIAHSPTVSVTGSPDPIRAEIVELALRETELSPRELAVRFTDEKRYFVSEASVYRLLKAHAARGARRMAKASQVSSIPPLRRTPR